MASCNQVDPFPNSRDPDEPAPDTNCNFINHTLISNGFEFKDIDTVIFRTYKKGTKFNEFLNEYKAIENIDFLSNYSPNSRENKDKRRSIHIPEEINANVDFIVLMGDSTQFKISNIICGWEQYYGQAYLGWGPNMKNYMLDGAKDSSGSNIHILKPGFVFPSQY